MAGKCTSILLERFVEDGCGFSVGAGVAPALVRGVVYPLSEADIADVVMDDDSELSLAALLRPVGRFAGVSWGDAATTLSAAAELRVLTMVFPHQGNPSSVHNSG